LREPYPVKVEYLPEHPEITRLRGERSGSVIGWGLRDLVLAPLLLIGFLMVGILILRDAILQCSIVKYFIRTNGPDGQMSSNFERGE
jgi:hypothetical protein